MSNTYDKLAQMSNVQDIWDHFSTDFRYAIEEPVSTETVRVRRGSQPPWFDRQAMKLYKKNQQRLYKKYRKTKNPYYSEKHRQQRRKNKSKLKRSTSLTKYADHLKREIVSPSSNIFNRNGIANTYWLPSNYMMVP